MKICPNYRKFFLSETQTEVIVFEELSSTMDIAVHLSQTEVSPWTSIVALKQLSGRGTHGRTWFSPQSSGLWTSVILPPPSNASLMQDLSIDTAECLAQSLLSLTNCKFEIKHPNDVMINNRKIAGILYESVTLNGEVKHVILGMGVNLLQSGTEFAEQGLDEAASVYTETGIIITWETLLNKFMSIFKPLYEYKILKSFASKCGEII
jgi:BirA family transcriptional regulator, biotin operon repressor / biotin---[acetyl-CoA-carboxylase] ligase